MKPRRNPVYKWGMVNYTCPDYEQCFEQAFRRHWEFWSCSKCSQNTGKKSEQQYGSNRLSSQSDSLYS
jgi:hypothetical protein